MLEVVYINGGLSKILFLHGYVGQRPQEGNNCV